MDLEVKVVRGLEREREMLHDVEVLDAAQSMALFGEISQVRESIASEQNAEKREELKEREKAMVMELALGQKDVFFNTIGREKSGNEDPSDMFQHSFLRVIKAIENFEPDNDKEGTIKDYFGKYVSTGLKDLKRANLSMTVSEDSWSRYVQVIKAEAWLKKKDEGDFIRALELVTLANREKVSVDEITNLSPATMVEMVGSLYEDFRGKRVLNTDARIEFLKNLAVVGIVEVASLDDEEIGEKLRRSEETGHRTSRRNWQESLASTEDNPKTVEDTIGLLDEMVSFANNLNKPHKETMLRMIAEYVIGEVRLDEKSHRQASANWKKLKEHMQMLKNSGRAGKLTDYLD